MVPGGGCIEAQRINRHIASLSRAPILEIARGLVTSPPENFISSKIFAC